ncbi:VCBS repeat-containing protein, partial [Cyclobacteriaceae bacterium]|nr:VCBS repeat-containing protein [Cyclobacteriaceae bacterium]
MKIKEYNNHTYMTRIAIITCLLGYSFGALAQCVEDTSFDADDLSIDDISLKWSSAPETANSHGQPFVADLDGDGSPEVIVTNEQNSTLNILNSLDNGAYDAISKSTPGAIDLGFKPYNTVAIGDLDGTGSDYPSIVVAGYTGTLASPVHKMSIWRYDEVANAMDHINTFDIDSLTGSNSAPGTIGIANFEGTDTDAKIYFANVILNADGSVYAQGTDADWP